MPKHRPQHVIVMDPQVAHTAQGDRGRGVLEARDAVSGHPEPGDDIGDRPHRLVRPQLLRARHPEGGDPGTRMTESGYAWSRWGENIYKAPRDPATAMAGWMDSPAHRDNILECSFKDVPNSSLLAASCRRATENRAAMGIGHSDPNLPIDTGSPGSLGY